MCDPKTIRFGIEIPQEGATYEDLRIHALEAERLGFHSFWLVDHVIPVFANNIPECWTTLTALAAVTKTIRFGPMVLNNSFRHPPLVANMAATLDWISGGRLELALGAGWMEKEYVTYGYEFPSTPVRMERLAEALQICKTMWTEDNPSFEGKHYRISDVTGYVKPIQRPHPPVWLGGTGEKLLLRIAAQYADRWNGPSLSVEDVARKIAILEEHCAAVGRDPKTIEKTWFGQVYIDEDEERLRRRLAGRTVILEEKVKGIILGTPEQCVAQLQKYVDVGITYFIVKFGRVSDLRSTRLFAEKVMPAFEQKTPVLSRS